VDYFTLPSKSSTVKISSPLSTTFDPFDVSWLLDSLFTPDKIENAENIQRNLETTPTSGQDIPYQVIAHGLDTLYHQIVTPGQDTLQAGLVIPQTVTNGMDIPQKATSGQDILETWNVFRSMHGGHSFITTKTTVRSTQLESAGQLCLPFSTPGEL